MKYKIPILAFLALLALFTFGNGQKNNLEYSNTYLSTPPEYVNGDIFYIPPFQLYNTTDKSLITFENAACNYNYFITANFKIWCFVPGDFQNFSLYELSSNLGQVLGIYNIPGVPGKQDQVFYDFFGTFINFFFSDFYIAFDTSTMQFVCPIYGKQIQGYGWFLNSSVVVVTLDGNNAEVALYPCTGTNPVKTIGINQGEQGPIYGMNQSTIFLRQMYKDNKFYYSCGIFDLTGRFHFGPETFEASGEPMNDTHIAFINPFGVGLYVINPNLEFVLVSQMAFAVNSTDLEISTIIGSSSVTVAFEGGQFYYDFDKQLIYNVSTFIPPIIMSNGSVVNLTVHGYFLQNPGEKIVFYKQESLDFYTNVSDSTKVYGFYGLANNGSSNIPCSLLRIDAADNLIQTFKLSFCPVNGKANIHDVVYDSEGNLNVAYTDDTQNLHIVNTNQALGPFDATAGISPIIVSIDLQNMVASYAGFNYTNDRNFVGGNFNINSGSINSSKQVEVGTVNNYVTKLSEKYFLVASTFTNSTSILFTWDSQTLSQFEPIHVDQFCNITGLVAVGVSEFNPNIFGEVLCQTGNSDYQIVSIDGQVKKVPIVGTNLYDIIKNGNNSFILILADQQLTSFEFYDVDYS